VCQLIFTLFPTSQLTAKITATTTTTTTTAAMARKWKIEKGKAGETLDMATTRNALRNDSPALC